MLKEQVTEFVFLLTDNTGFGFLVIYLKREKPKGSQVFYLILNVFFVIQDAEFDAK